jgi:hypothetical protein
MAVGKESAERSTALTERDRFWLEHVKRIADEGIEAKAYAAREGLSAHALYQGKKRLVRLGAWPRGEKRAAFARVRLVEDAIRPVKPVPHTDPVALRLRLPSGAVLEWSAQPGADLSGSRRRGSPGPRARARSRCSR